MPDPVLRIPIDDEAFKRYIEAFQRYQEQLGAQPEMWEEANDASRDGIAINLALADAIGASVAAAIRLGDVQERNSQNRKRSAQEENANEERAASWRRKSLDHVQELSRSTATVVRGIASFGTGGGGGLFGGITAAGKGLGGDIGAVVNLIGHTLNANYELNNAASTQGLFSQGIGATPSEQLGFQAKLGRYTNTDQGIDSVMNARGDPSQWAQFSMLGIDRNKGTNAEQYGEALRKQVALAKRHMDAQGNIKFYETDPRGGSAFGTTHEDLNRLVKAKDLDKEIDKAVAFKTDLNDKTTASATKSLVAVDSLTAQTTAAAQAINIQFNPALDKATAGLQALYDAAHGLVAPGGAPALGPSQQPGKPFARSNDGTMLGWLNNRLNDAAQGLGHMIGLSDKDMGMGGPTARAGGGARSMGPHTAFVPGDRDRAESAIVGIGGHITSRTRSFAEQKRLYDEWRANPGAKPRGYVVARPGHSDHETGQALDIRRGAGISKASITEALIKAGIAIKGRVLDEGDHYHVSLAGRSTPARAAAGSGGAANVQVHVKVAAPPGHQTAVTTNSAARG